MSDYTSDLESSIRFHSNIARYYKTPLILRLVTGAFIFFTWSCANHDKTALAPDLNRKDFVSAYIKLSTADMQNLEVRDSILENLNLSSNHLEEFVDYHGKDVDFMAKLWDEIEAGIDLALNKSSLAP